MHYLLIILAALVFVRLKFPDLPHRADWREYTLTEREAWDQKRRERR